MPGCINLHFTYCYLLTYLYNNAGNKRVDLVTLTRANSVYRVGQLK